MSQICTVKKVSMNPVQMMEIGSPLNSLLARFRKSLVLDWVWTTELVDETCFGEEQLSSTC